jgi:hypothetical protein
VTIVLAAGLGFFDVEAFGNFKQMVHSGDTAGKVPLSRFRNAKGVYGVGALAGLHGEIWIWDGKVVVSRGDSVTGATEPASDSDQAALLVTARVKAWKEIPVDVDMTPNQFEKYVLHQAGTNGIDVKEPFLFSVRGSIRDYQRHVVTGAGAGHGESKIACSKVLLRMLCCSAFTLHRILKVLFLTPANAFMFTTPIRQLPSRDI